MQDPDVMKSVGGIIDVSSLGSPSVFGTKRIEPAKAVQPTSPKQSELEKLENDHATKLLRLASSRRTLRHYRAGLWGLLAATCSAGGMALAGIGLALVSSALGVDASTAVTWLECVGWPATAAGVGSLFLWDGKYRIYTKWANRGYNNYVRESMAYVDPWLNVQIAEHEYSLALTKLAALKGNIYYGQM